MQHATMNSEQATRFEGSGCCPQCVHEPLKRGVNLKQGWWLCVACETWWQDPAT